LLRGDTRTWRTSRPNRVHAPRALEPLLQASPASPGRSIAVTGARPDELGDSVARRYGGIPFLAKAAAAGVAEARKELRVPD
jgi:hypothetical protein